MALVTSRGRRNPLADEVSRGELVEWLKEQQAQFLIVDPFANAFSGDNMNDTAEVKRWLHDLDTVIDAAGCSEALLVNHAGWNGQSRNSSALVDWADSIVTLTRNDDDERFIKAEGRDVQLSEDRLDYDPLTRRLSLTGTGSKRANKNKQNLSGHIDALVRVVASTPGISVNQIELAWKASGHHHQNGDASKASREAEQQGLVVITRGSRNSRQHHLPSVTTTTHDHPRMESGGRSRLTTTTPIEGVVSEDQSDLLTDHEESERIEQVADQLGATTIEVA